MENVQIKVTWLFMKMTSFSGTWLSREPLIFYFTETITLIVRYFEECDDKKEKGQQWAHFIKALGAELLVSDLCIVAVLQKRNWSILL